MTDARPYEAFIFDLGGVIVDWDPRYLLREIVPDERELTFLVEEVLDLRFFRDVDSGRSLSEAVAARAERYPDHADALRAYIDRWPETIRGLYEETLDILDALAKQGYPLFALTNWASETWDRVSGDFIFLDRFEDIIVSGQVGMAKPDSKIFELSRDRFGVDPARTLFIDDNPANIAAAREFGFAAFRFSSPAELRKQLDRHGILPKTAGD